jgi:predicted transcriptional regulator
MEAEEVLLASVESPTLFVRSIRTYLGERNLSAKEFCERSGMPSNTLYKILSGQREDFMLSNLKRLVRSMRAIDESERGETIGVITARGALDTLQRTVRAEGRPRPLRIREYPAMTIEEEIIQGIRAERERMKGIICGPIAANTLEKVVRIPVVALQFKEDALLEAVERLSNKL